MCLVKGASEVVHAIVANLARKIISLSSLCKVSWINAFAPKYEKAATIYPAGNVWPCIRRK